MRTFTVGHLITACVAAYATSLPVAAQQSMDSAPPPPRLEKLEEGEEPAVTITAPGRKSSISEMRVPGGKITEVRVSGSNNAYYLKANNQVGSALPGDAQSSSMRAAQWEVLVFGLPGAAEPKEAAAEVVPVPLPPALAPN